MIEFAWYLLGMLIGWWCSEMMEPADKKKKRKPEWQGLQDGLLEWLKMQSGSADANVEKRLDKEPFDFRDHMKNPPGCGKTT